MPDAYECCHSATVTTDTNEAIKAETPEAAAEAFRVRHGFWPDSVDDDEVCICEACEAVIVGDAYTICENSGATFCEACSAMADPFTRPEPPTT